VGVGPTGYSAKVGSEEKLQEILTAQAVMSRDLTDDRGKGPDAQWIMPRDGDVVLAVLDRGQAEMASGLTGDLIAERRSARQRSSPDRPRGSLTGR
jgi:hypothetical protein